jgi:CRISPR-associated endonuclease Cas1
MAATKNVAHPLRVRKSKVPEILAAHPQLSIKPRRGVITLFGYGIQVRVDSGHLILEDGMGANRQYARFARAGHGLKRLIVIGNEGIVSLAALRWLADQNVAFVLIERDGKVVATAGQTQARAVRVRRAQGLALQSGIGIRIAQHLISVKLEGQEHLVRQKFHESEVADAIAEQRSVIGTLENFDAIRFVEAQAAALYWSAWRSLKITFPSRDIPRVPAHWQNFTRSSPLTGSNRLAANPVNAILNYLYAVLEAEVRLSAIATGMDPCLGFLHADTPHRDSLIFDLMEPVRPRIDAFVLDWVSRTALQREWFFELGNGNCRLMAPLACRLSETASTWRQIVAPHAEWVTRTLWSAQAKHSSTFGPATPLTQRRRREVRGGTPLSPKPPERLPNICQACGLTNTFGYTRCRKCDAELVVLRMRDAARAGRIAAQSPRARAARAEKQRQQQTAQRSWDPAAQPSWLTKEFYLEHVRPKLHDLPTSAVARTIGVSLQYAVSIRHGTFIPHPRHWLKLAELVGISALVQTTKCSNTGKRPRVR